MGAGIMVGDGSVPTLADKLAVFDHYRAYRHFALRSSVAGEPQGMTHPMKIGFE
jgi:hypothetical protein